MTVEIKSKSNGSIDFRISNGSMVQSGLSSYSNIDNCQTGGYWNYLRLSKAIIQDVLGDNFRLKLATDFQKVYFNINKWPEKGILNRRFNVEQFFERHSNNMNYEKIG